MTCDETQKSFSPYLDGALTRAAAQSFDAHLDACPVCRLHLDETRRVVRGLSSLARTPAPASLAASISSAVMIERAARGQQPELPLTERLARWLEPRLMPYTVGLFASLLLFVTLANALRPQMRALRDAAIAARQSDDDTVVWIRNGDFNLPYPIRLEDLAVVRSRSSFGSESPSLNPRSDLFKIMTTPGGDEEDGEADDITIVANVFSNGSASVAEVMQSPRNPAVLAQVQAALRRNPAFVPASLDRRPQTMRVVLSLSKVSVHDNSY